MSKVPAPAPWNILRSGGGWVREIVDCNGRAICYGSIEDADADMIVAAPDMYAALKAVSEMQAANYGYGMETHMKLADLMLQVRAALAKAAP